MKLENGIITYTDMHEKELCENLTEHIMKAYKGKRDLKRLVNNINWYRETKGGDFFQGFVYDCQGTISYWGTYEGGKDKEKYSIYADFMQNHCDKVMEQHSMVDGSIVSIALVRTYKKLLALMKERELVCTS